jgi:ubiquinone biosynthesis monooxygenase Coq7
LRATFAARRPEKPVVGGDMIRRSIRENDRHMHASRTDQLIDAVDRFLRVLAVPAPATRALPEPAAADRAAAVPLTEAERRHAAGLMRVNHVGEICAQALYSAQSMVARDAEVKAAFVAAGREESDHLAWTATRLEQLGARPSVLNPVWYAGSFALGWLAGMAGDRVSLGFVVETERQVEEHLAGHLATLPESDVASRAIVDVMRADEATHRRHAEEAGAEPLPRPVAAAMRGVARLMTTTAYHL